MDPLGIDLCSDKRRPRRASVPGIVPTQAATIFREIHVEFPDRLCIHTPAWIGELYSGSVFISCHSLPTCAGLGLYHAKNRQPMGLDLVSRRNGHPDHAWYFLESLIGYSTQEIQAKSQQESSITDVYQSRPTPVPADGRGCTHPRIRSPASFANPPRW